MRVNVMGSLSDRSTRAFWQGRLLCVRCCRWIWIGQRCKAVCHSTTELLHFTKYKTQVMVTLTAEQQPEPLSLSPNPSILRLPRTPFTPVDVQSAIINNVRIQQTANTAVLFLFTYNGCCGLLEVINTKRRATTRNRKNVKSKSQETIEVSLVFLRQINLPSAFQVPEIKYFR